MDEARSHAPAPEGAVPGDAFIAAMRLVPAPVALVTVVHDGRRQGLAVTAWSSLSTAPPALLVCISRNASAQDAIIAAGAFGLSLADQSHREAVVIFSRQRGLMGDDRFLPGAWSAGPRGQPPLAGAVAAFECRLIRVEDGGTPFDYSRHGDACRRRPRPLGAALLRRRFRSARARDGEVTTRADGHRHACLSSLRTS